MGIVYILLSTTKLGVYAVAGVSSILLLFRVLIFAPMYAAHNLKIRYFTFYPTLFKGIASSCVILVVYVILKMLLPVYGWIQLLFLAVIGGGIGYFIVFVMLFNKEERKRIIVLLKERLRKSK